MADASGTSSAEGSEPPPPAKRSLNAVMLGFLLFFLTAGTSRPRAAPGRLSSHHTSFSQAGPLAWSRRWARREPS